jgi:hypothetical protein
MRNNGQVRFDMGLAQESEHLAPRELLDHLAVSGLHHALEIAPDLEHAVGFPALDHCALDRSQAVPEHAYDQIVEHVRLGLDRPAPVVLTHQRDDPVGDLRQQFSAGERSGRRPETLVRSSERGHRNEDPYRDLICA